MMSRELKLALILGFAAVMVVGVLISDHMSGARQARIEERTLQTPPLALSTPSTGDYAVAPQHQPERLTQTLPEDAPPMLEPEDAPVVIVMGSEPAQTEAPASALASAETGTLTQSEFLAWSEKLGVPFEEIMPSAPLLQTTPRTRNPSPSEALPDATAPRQAADRTHTVEEGETLWAIAERYYGNGALYARIEEANSGRLGKGDALYVGAKLVIPGGDRAAAKPAPKRSESPRNAFTPKQAVAKDRFHVVQKGETLGDIARKTLGSAKRWPDIVKANKGTITDPDDVPAGLRIRIPEN